jgi:hypothetical protein
VSEFGGFEFSDSSQLIDPGVESVDHWIGKDAEKRADVIQRRQHRKKQLRHKHGDGQILTRRPSSGDDGPMPEGHYDVVDSDHQDDVQELHQLEEEFVNADEDDVQEVEDFSSIQE